jgi:hypothetical protein
MLEGRKQTDSPLRANPEPHRPGPPRRPLEHSGAARFHATNHLP